MAAPFVILGAKSYAPPGRVDCSLLLNIERVSAVLL
jgi:hypothetical protein